MRLFFFFFFTQILFTLPLISSLSFTIHTPITLNSRTLHPSDEIPYLLLSMQTCIDDVKVMDDSEQTEAHACNDDKTEAKTVSSRNSLRLSVLSFQTA